MDRVFALRVRFSRVVTYYKMKVSPPTECRRESEPDEREANSTPTQGESTQRSKSDNAHTQGEAKAEVAEQR